MEMDATAVSATQVFSTAPAGMVTVPGQRAWRYVDNGNMIEVRPDVPDARLQLLGRHSLTGANRKRAACRRSIALLLGRVKTLSLAHNRRSITAIAAGSHSPRLTDSVMAQGDPMAGVIDVEYPWEAGAGGAGKAGRTHTAVVPVPEFHIDKTPGEARSSDIWADPANCSPCLRRKCTSNLTARGPQTQAVAHQPMCALTRGLALGLLRETIMERQVHFQSSC